MYSFLAVLALWTAWGLSLIEVSWDYSLAAGHRLLTAVSSLVARAWALIAGSGGAGAHGLSSCTSQTLEHELSSFDT